MYLQLDNGGNYTSKYFMKFISGSLVGQALCWGVKITLPGIVNVNVKGMWKSFISTIVAHVFSNNRQLIVWKRIQTRNLFSNLLSHPLIHYFFSSSNIQIIVSQLNYSNIINSPFSTFRPTINGFKLINHLQLNDKVELVGENG